MSIVLKNVSSVFKRFRSDSVFVFGGMIIWNKNHDIVTTNRSIYNYICIPVVLYVFPSSRIEMNSTWTTLPETNMTPENIPLEVWRFRTWKPSFLGVVVVSFRECICCCRRHLPSHSFHILHLGPSTSPKLTGYVFPCHGSAEHVEKHPGPKVETRVGMVFRSMLIFSVFFFDDTPLCSNPFCKWFWSWFWVPKHLLTGYLKH